MRQRPFRVRLAGVRTSWRTLDDGDFFCPDCGGDRRYRRRTGRRRFVLLGVPLVPRGPAGPVVECVACRAHFAADVLDHPTTTRLSAMLREAVHSVALAVLAAGGADARPVRETAVETVRAAGFPGCTEEELTALLAALTAESRSRRSQGHISREIELHEVLAPLAPHLAVPGRESLLLQGARIALADGLYCSAEREVLATVGRALEIGAEDVDRLLAEARTPS
ncbi:MULTISPECIES: TerB family tellurite resistance protein [unclassified Streptomyces]|uniref:TerB family tellurite resistance protein n=1 Tax=unclassified Streptomyces TaxID=2593676 RepID=UPI002DDA770B|nr:MULTISPECIES: TerB family tellurite resistance protein [unclassified Streptomyces]WSA94837.1 TerB family tellurite resistance protein [Streptomyces sp. NBC_01795]WSB79257.1 TerB family tellurite resistance protein [Streptomyces sp. NBC_01775]WSS12539.1 TerB family tellurite resistance protein [Streptomyces sp. NBC_01186]WSS41325.1 TerB family tellurite resistance protein [Streptomyces sp. NBC_01187]